MIAMIPCGPCVVIPARPWVCPLTSNAQLCLLCALSNLASMCDCSWYNYNCILSVWNLCLTHNVMCTCIGTFNLIYAIILLSPQTPNSACSVHFLTWRVCAITCHTFHTCQRYATILPTPQTPYSACSVHFLTWRVCAIAFGTF